MYDTWRNDKTDYSVSNLKYDLNGNILSMKQRGMGLVNGVSTPVDIDKLNYTYNNQTNQLLSVYDSATVDYGTGDFQNTNGNNADYFYSVNGTLIKDNNKGIFSVAYSYLHKPTLVMMTPASNRIGYSYDAAGNKVQQFSIINGVTKLTDYVGNFVYEDNVLKYIFTPEGRSTYDPATHTFKEEFFVKDHLDNVRSVVDVYTYPILQYLAGYEIASANLEGLFFDNMDAVRDDKPGSINPDDNKAGNLNGADPNRRIGTSTLLKVMAGDKVELNVNNFYDGYNAGDDQPVSMEDMLGSVISTLTGGQGGFTGSETHNTKLVADVFNMPNYEAFNQLLNQNSDAQKPKAYLNYLLFNERMELVPEMSGAFQAGGNGSWTQIGTTAPMVIPANGYLAVYLSNSSVLSCGTCGNVYFDQLVVRMTTGKLKEEAHYYPFGLPISTMGSAAVGFIPNKNKYQSNEYTKELGLNWMDFHNRQYDPQIGRFMSVDPLAAATADVSPYAAMDNDPVLNVDPLGLQPGEPNWLQAPNNRPSFRAWAYSSPLNQLDRWQQFKSPNAPGGIDYEAEEAASRAWFDQQRKEQWAEMLGVAFHNQGETHHFNNGVYVGTDAYNSAGTILLPGLEVVDGKPNYFKWGKQVDAMFGSSFDSPLSDAFFKDGPKSLHSSFADGNISAQDVVNLSIAGVSSGLNTFEGMLRGEKAAVMAKISSNGLNSYYRREMQSLTSSINSLEKYSKRLGYVGAALTVGSLTYKYFNDGITKKDVFDAAVSGALLFISVSNPIGIIGLGVYGLLDATGVFDGIKESFGADDDVILKY